MVDAAENGGNASNGNTYGGVTWAGCLCARIGPYKFDNTGPTINSVTKNPSGWTNGNVTLTVSATDSNAGIATTGGYSFNNGNSWQDGNTKEYTANENNIQVQVKDKLGNISSTSVDITNIDTTAPTISISMTTANQNNWTKTKSVTITVSDTGGSGLNSGNVYEYALSTSNSTAPTTGWGNTYTSGTAFTIGSGLDGTYYLWVNKIVDNAGNWSNNNNYTCYATGLKFDNTPIPASGTVLNSDTPGILFRPYNGEGIYNKSYTVSVYAVDSNQASDNTITLKYVWSTSTTAPADASFTNTASNEQSPAEGGKILNDHIVGSGYTGDYYLWLRVSDKAGNVTKMSSGLFKFDNTAPTIEFTYSTTNTSYLKSQTVVINLTDNVGFDFTNHPGYYKWGSAPTTSSYDGTITSTSTTVTRNTGTGTYKLYVLAYDALENSSPGTTADIKLDNTVPSAVAFATNGSTAYAKSRSTVVTITDGHSGVSGVTQYYLWSTSSSGVTTENITGETDATVSGTFNSGGTVSLSGKNGDWYLWISARDALGNVKDPVKSNVFKLDNTKNTFTVSLENGTTYTQKKKLTFVGNWSVDSLSGIYGYYCFSTNSNLTTWGGDESGTLFSNKRANTTVTPDVGGTLTGSNYYMYVYLKDYAGNYGTCSSSGGTAVTVGTISAYRFGGNYAFDNTKPTITFSPEPDTTWRRSLSITVTVTDGQVGTLGTLKYQWAQTDNEEELEPWTSATEFTVNASTHQTTIPGNGFTSANNYYLWVQAPDSLGNVLVDKGGPYYVDNTLPTITLSVTSASTWTKTKTATITWQDTHSGLNSSNEYKYAVTTSSSTVPTSWTTVTSFTTNTATKRVAKPSIGSGLNGTYYLWVAAISDNTSPTVYTCSNATSSILYFDNTAVPDANITISPGSAPTYTKSKTITVTATDTNRATSPDNTLTLKYLWTTSSTEPSSSSFGNASTGTGGYKTQSITNNTLTGQYYLWVQVTDKAGNITTKRGGLYYFDNTAPIIRYNPPGS